MLRTYVYERTYVLLKYDSRLKYPLCYDPLVRNIWNVYTLCFISLSLPCIRSCFFVGLSYHDCSLHKPSYCKWLQMYRFSYTCFDVGPRFKPKKKNGKLPQQLIIYAFFRPFFCGWYFDQTNKVFNLYKQYYPTACSS